MKLLDGIEHELDSASRWLANARAMAERGDRNGQMHALRELAGHAEAANHAALTVVRCVEGGWPMETSKTEGRSC